MYVCVGRIRCISCSDSPTFETRQREKGKDNLTMHMAEVFPWLASLDCDCFHLTSKAPTTARDLFINYSDGLGISLWGHSITTWTRFWLFLTTYLPRRGHFLPKTWTKRSIIWPPTHLILSTSFLNDLFFYDSHFVLQMHKCPFCINITVNVTFLHKKCLQTLIRSNVIKFFSLAGFLLHYFAIYLLFLLSAAKDAELA